MSDNVSENTLALPSDVLQKQFNLPISDVSNDTDKLQGFNPYVFMAGDLGLILESNNTVSEVIDNLPMCQIPNAPPHLHSMANLRGSIIPIFDLAIIFDFENKQEKSNNKLLIIGVKGKAVGVLIDKIPIRISFSNKNKVELLADLPKKLSPYARSCYEKNGTIWVNWDVNGFFNSLATISSV